jgi:predicted esterase
MAFRAAAASTRQVRALVVAGGDVPPELDAVALRRIPSVLLARGRADEWYTAEKLSGDRARLEAAGVTVEALEFAGGHEWAPPLVDACRAYLGGCR